MGMLDLFEQYEGRRNLARRTIDDRHRRLASLEAWVGGDLYDATKEDIDAWLDAPRPALTPPSRYTYITAVNAFFRWAVREGFLLTNPCDRVDRPRLPHRSPRPLSLEQVHLMLEQAPTRTIALWVALGAFAGFRVSEMAALQVPEVDFARRKITAANAKGHKDGVVPLHDEVVGRLRSLPIPRAGLVTPKHRGVGQYRAATVGIYLGRHMRSLGIEGTPHQLRHFFVTEVVERGDLYVGKEAARHASISSTVEYAALAHGRVDRAVLGIGTLDVAAECPVIGRACPLGHGDRCGV